MTKLFNEMCNAIVQPGIYNSAKHVSFENADVDSEDVYDVVGFAAASIATAAFALNQYVYGKTAPDHSIEIDNRLSYLWFQGGVKPIGWQQAPIWDDLAGDYKTKDGWIRLHTNAPHHRQVVVETFGLQNRGEIESKIRRASAAEIEVLIRSRGGAVARLMRADEWANHPQGKTASAAQLIDWQYFATKQTKHHTTTPERPLDGIKVLDLTRILAGPVASRFLSGFGANVLRIDPPGWHEGDYIVDITPGKRCATLNLKNTSDLAVLKQLIAEADVMVHGLRADALSSLGLSELERRSLNPSLIDVCLNAYGWGDESVAPWKNFRGFDSLVQMSSGIAAHGMQVAKSGKPRPMTVQALDHATGYLMAASILSGLTHLRQNGEACSTKLSLAASAELLKSTRRDTFGNAASSRTDEDFQAEIESTPWGDIQRLKSPFKIDGIDMKWSSPAVALHSSKPRF